jgi:hypothetical protein
MQRLILVVRKSLGYLLIKTIMIQNGYLNNPMHIFSIKISIPIIIKKRKPMEPKKILKTKTILKPMETKTMLK